MAATLFEKLWREHSVADLGEGEHLLYIDRVFLHERTGSIALKSLADANRDVRNPERTFCTMDHIVDTFPGRGDDTLMPNGRDFIEATRASTAAANILLFDVDHQDQGIAHVLSPELGIALPGLTLVCPDSHTCSLGGVGALAWGIGSSEAEHALCTGTLRVKKPLQMRITVHGALAKWVTAKDIILYIIGRYGAAGGHGYAVEFAGSAIRALGVEARLTLCNMAVEFSAFTGIIAPDQKVIDYFHGKRYAPQKNLWLDAVDYWRTLQSDSDARFDLEYVINAEDIPVMTTWGTSPQHTVPVRGVVPNPLSEQDQARAATAQRALDYQQLSAGDCVGGIAIDAAFLGSCTNSRLSDLQIAADLLRGRRVAAGVQAVVVPGSRSVKRQAEALGLDKIFEAAGFEWRDSGCSMCFYAGGETFGAKKRVISSTNRNFEGRQGPGTRTHLASPAVVIASAVTGFITSPSMLDGDVSHG